MYVRKTEDEWQLIYDYGYGDGPEIIDRCSTFTEAKANRIAYAENEGILPLIRKRRVKINGGN